MVSFNASLRLPNERDSAIRVQIDLANDRLRLTSGDTLIGDWGLDEIRVNAMRDGFHLRAEGETIILDLTEDAEFAVALGLNSAPPDLARRMSMVRDGRP